MNGAATLAQLQRQVQAVVLTGHGSVDAVTGDAQADAQERLDVYAQAYRLRLQEVLENDYPGLRALAGEDFARLCGEYLDASPSRHFNARWFGGGLAAFLRGSVWVMRPQYAEMAQFEWELTLAFDAQDQAHATPEAVAALPPQQWPDMQLQLLDHCRRVAPHWNVADARKAALREEALPPPRRLDAPQPLLVWRRNLAVHYRTLDADEAAALDAAAQGVSFGELCERLCEWHAPEAVAPRAVALLQRWIADQCLAPL